MAVGTKTPHSDIRVRRRLGISARESFSVISGIVVERLPQPVGQICRWIQRSRIGAITLWHGRSRLSRMSGWLLAAGHHWA
jgi:hypothetical protein